MYGIYRSIFEFFVGSAAITQSVSTAMRCVMDLTIAVMELTKTTSVSVSTLVCRQIFEFLRVHCDRKLKFHFFY